MSKEKTTSESKEDGGKAVDLFTEEKKKKENGNGNGNMGVGLGEKANQLKTGDVKPLKLPQSVVVKCDREKCEESFAQEQKEQKREEIWIKQEMQKEKSNNNEEMIQENNIDFFKIGQCKEKVSYWKNFFNSANKQYKEDKVPNRKGQLDKVHSMFDIKSNIKDELSDDDKDKYRKKSSYIYDLKNELVSENEKEHIEKKKPLYSHSFNDVSCGRLYFIINKSSICTTDNKFVKLFESYYERAKDSDDEIKKKDRNKRRKLANNVGANLEKNKHPISKNKNNRDAPLIEDKLNDDIIVKCCSDDSSSVISDDKIEVEDEEQSNSSSYNDEFDNGSRNATGKYRSCYVTDVKFLDELLIGASKDNNEDVSQEFPIGGVEKDVRTPIIVSHNKTSPNKIRAICRNNTILKEKKKEKIIIFLNRKYCVWENDKFNDHFYNTIYKKNGVDAPEEVEIYIDDFKKSRIKRFIYRIFPQFSPYSLLLYVSCIQCIIYILLLSLQTDVSHVTSQDTLNVGSNYPMRIFQYSEYHRLFTSLFLHCHFNHICANIYIQLTVGFLLEYLYGTMLVFFVYIFTGMYGIIMASPLSYCESTTESTTSTFGIIGMFSSEILIMTNFNVDKINIGVNLICYYLLLLFLKFSLNTSSINIWSHFFGFIGGFLFGIILKFKQLKYFVKHDLLILAFCITFFITSTVFAVVLTLFYPKCAT